MITVTMRKPGRLRGGDGVGCRRLYNIGLTAGFLGLLVAAIVSASRGALALGAKWNPEPSLALVVLVPALCVVLLCAAAIMGGKGLWRGFLQMMRLPGRLPSDFMDAVSIPAGLLNMAAMGVGAWLYVVVVRGPLNGPVLGGIFTVIAFSAFGKHPRNCWPVVAGVIAATLAPVAGEFGPLVGLTAGFLHLLVVERTGAWHLGIDLYNNGFAGGLTATYVVAVIEWFRSRPGRRPAASPPSDSQDKGAA